MIRNNAFLSLLLAFLISSCATFEPQYKSTDDLTNYKGTSRTIEQSFYLIGDAGGSERGGNSEAISAFKNYIESNNSKNSYAVFLGDNIYEKGLPKKENKQRELAEHRIQVQIDAVSDYKGKVLFVPGNHDWYSGLDGLKRQEKYIEDALDDKDVFQPENGCPMEKIDVTDNIVILAIDSQWFITDWDKHATINTDCEIKTRKDFFVEVEDIFKKNNEKTILIAMHHPAFTHGPHGGSYSFRQHIFPFNNGFPLPGLGSLIAQVRSQGGVSPQDRYNINYDNLMDRLITYAKGNDRVIFVSGHEHSLQYIENAGVKQIVSGSGSKTSATQLGDDGLFTYGAPGYVVLDIFNDGSSEAKYYAAEEGKGRLVFSTQIYEATKEYDTSSLPSQFESTMNVSAVDAALTSKGKSYEWFWGEHYRYVYGTDIKVPVATLDTLNGGYTIERKGGGHQSRSLRVIDSKGRNFALRAVTKSAVQFLQTVAFKDIYVKEDFRETATESLVMDFFTSSHPYATFVVSELSDEIGLYHTNPMLFYMPKHSALGKYNEEFGDELYVIEERPDDDFTDIPSFGFPDGIESTDDVKKKLVKDEKYQIDEAAFIKARLFDMLIGDWDRHEDQWRWSRFDISEDKKVFRPIPRDRDQAFSNYDGALLDIMKFIIPSTKQFQKFSSEQKEVKWLNLAGIKMDRNFTQNSVGKDWLKQAQYIQENLTDEDIEEAFNRLPIELQDEVADDIRRKLKIRLKNLDELAMRYYDYLARLVIITGTDKDDFIEITRGHKNTKVSVARIKDGIAQKPYKERVINSNETKEIWIYGLDDDDQIVDNGTGEKPVLIRIVGGQNNDVFTFENGQNIKVYEPKSRPNTMVKKGKSSLIANNIYENNVYDFDRLIQPVNSIIPAIGSNPDDGFKFGLTDTFTLKGFHSDPFQQKHVFRFGYYFSTNGFDLEYTGEFSHVIGKWNLLIGLSMASDNYTQNFFGVGNETENMDNELGFDYNRVKSGIISGKIGIAKDGHSGSRIEIDGLIERIDIEDTDGRFISEFFEGMPDVFEKKTFGGLEFTYSFESYDNKASPRRGMDFSVTTAVKTDISDFNKTYGLIRPSLEFLNAISRNKKLVLRTMIQGQFNIGDEFEFYQSATLGADNGLRGFRRERFSGKSALAFRADLKYSIIRLKTSILPLELGVFGGYDYGRVWVPDEKSNTWHDSIGGGLWVNAVDSLYGFLGFFNSDDGLRVSFGFGVSL